MKGVRRTVKEMRPYAWEESSGEIARKRGLQASEVVRFDMNENPFVLGAVRQAAESLSSVNFNDYPLPSYATLVAAVAGYANAEEGQVVVGSGLDEVIDVIAKAFLDDGDSSIIPVPTYSMYRVSSDVYGAKAIEVERNPEDYSFDAGELVEASRQAKLLWLCNPNSPTGNLTPGSEVEKLVGAADCTVVVDEAYAEFCGQSLAAATGKYDNLIVLRSLSKAFGLASARVGYAITSEALAAQLNKVRPPCSISRTSVKLAEAALSGEGVKQMRENVAKIVAARSELKSSMEALGLKCFPSVTNFLLVNFGDRDANKVFEALLSKGLVVRNYSRKKLTPNCLRITVRKPDENARLVSVIGEALKT